MRALAGKTIEAALMGFATFAGVRLMQELSDPYSDLRLHLSSIVDRLREVTP